VQPSESCERVRACCIALLHTAPHTGAAFVGDPVTNYVDWLAAEQDAVGSYEVQIGIDLLMGDDARRNGARRLLKLGRSELARQACEKLLVNPQLAAVLDKHVGRQPRGVNIEARVNRDGRRDEEARTQTGRCRCPLGGLSPFIDGAAPVAYPVRGC